MNLNVAILIALSAILLSYSHAEQPLDDRIQTEGGVVIDRVFSDFESGVPRGLLMKGKGKAEVSLPKRTKAESDGLETYYSFRVRPALSLETREPAIVDLGGAAISFHLVPERSDRAEIRVLDDKLRNGRRDKEDWRTTGAMFSVRPDGTLKEPVELTVRTDNQNKTWDLYCYGNLIESGMGYKQKLERFLVESASDGQTIVDSLAIAEEIPIFTRGMREAFKDNGMSFETP